MDEIKRERRNMTNHGHHALLDMDLQVCYDDKWLVELAE